MGRPKKYAGGGKTKSIWLSPEALEIVQKNGFQSNLSAYFDSLIKSTSEDSPEIIKIKIMDMRRQLAKVEDAANAIRTERDILQAKLNLYKAKGDTIGSARNELLGKYWDIVKKDRLRGETSFYGWLSGPANIHFVKEAGYQTADEAVAWCKQQEGRSL
jgi:hypothetical protein